MKCNAWVDEVQNLLIFVGYSLQRPLAPSFYLMFFSGRSLLRCCNGLCSRIIQGLTRGPCGGTTGSNRSKFSKKTPLRRHNFHLHLAHPPFASMSSYSSVLFLASAVSSLALLLCNGSANTGNSAIALPPRINLRHCICGPKRWTNGVYLKYLVLCRCSFNPRWFFSLQGLFSCWLTQARSC